MEFKIRLFTAVIFWTNLTVVCCSYPNDMCPRIIGDTWRVDKKDGEYRCILSCSDEYVPSGCHVIRPLHGGGYNIPTPSCEKAPYVSSTTVAAVGACVGVMLAVPYALGAAGFTAAGVAVGSLAATLQGAEGVAGRLIAGQQDAGVAGIGILTKTVIGGICYTIAEYVIETFTGCEAE